ncbi:sugar kinase [Palleronia sediminis]|uniref:Sugar kinase n=1 Tax=Palleronia sediminis TaxID=2547833 RepID=A0A4R6A7Z5_9RHOB|nr:sugar kinase [Palleronia sediminis]TDL78348.1 sugar kinase [Palleronia sediminis]
MGARVACVGLTILDILGRPVERIPEGGGLAFIDEIRLTVAGTAAGTVIDMAKLGVPSMLVGAVGDDEKGRFVLNTLEGFGVDISAMQTVAGVPTSATILNVRPNGDRPALHQRGASDRFTMTDSVALQIAGCEIVHVGGNGLLRDFDGPPTANLLKAAKQNGATTTYDLLAPGADVLTDLESYLPNIDYFMPAMEEAAEICGEDDPDRIADFFLERGAGACIFKWGARGSFYATRSERHRIPALKVNVVDTTGCGDAYCAGFVSGLIDGLSPLEACSRGTAAAALVATGLGSDAGIVDLAHLEAFRASATVLDG